MKSILRALLLIALAIGLNACSWLRGEDNTEPPAELTDIKARVELNKRWQRDIGSDIDEQFVRLRPALADGRIFAADRKGRVTALNSADGKELWQVKTGIAVSSGVGVGAGLVLVGSSEAELVALDMADGKERWRTVLSSEILSVPAAAGDIVVVQTVDGKLTALSATDGTRNWVADQSVPVLSLRGTGSPLLIQNAIIAGFDNGKLAVLDMQRGIPAWETSIGVAHGRSELERMVDIDSQPQVWGGVIYTVTFQGRVAAVEGNSGRILWARDMSSVVGLGVDFQHVYVTDEVSHLWALERTNGASVWKQDKLTHRALTAPVAFGEYVAVADFEGYVHLLARYDGEIVARARADSKGVLATPLVDGDTLYIYGNGGTLTAYSIVDKS